MKSIAVMPDYLLKTWTTIMGADLQLPASLPQAMTAASHLLNLTSRIRF